MPGANIFAARKRGLPQGWQSSHAAQACVFISHKREDADMARAVANALMEFEVDVWLDLDELGFPEPTTEAEHVRLTQAIEAGLGSCTHLLALITANTKGSWWVPFEIGSCRSAEKPLAFLLHKDVREVPSYFAVGTGLETKHQLFAWAKELSGKRLDIDRRAAIAVLQRSELDNYVELILERN